MNASFEGVEAGRALDLRELVRGLEASAVRYVIAGSVAAKSWAPDLPAPNDLDIVPDLEPGNLRRLAERLSTWDARPVHRPDWKRTLSHEACAAWRPEPATAEQLDHQLRTPHGLLDVVPAIAGPHSEIVTRAQPAGAWGMPVLVAHPEDLLRTLRLDREPKHRRRRTALEDASRRAKAGARPLDFDLLNLEAP